MSNTKPRRRWYQYSLRTMLVAFTLVCVGFGYWVHWSKEWIRQRHEFLKRPAVSHMAVVLRADQSEDRRRAPGGLWLESLTDAQIDAVAQAVGIEKPRAAIEMAQESWLFNDSGVDVAAYDAAIAKLEKSIKSKE